MKQQQQMQQQQQQQLQQQLAEMCVRRWRSNDPHQCGSPLTSPHVPCHGSSQPAQPTQPTLVTSASPSSAQRTGYFLGCRQFVCRILFVVNSFFDLFRIVFGIDSSSTWLDFCTLRTT